MLAWAGEYNDPSCAVDSVLSRSLNLIVFDHDSSSTVNFEIIRYIVVIIVRKLYRLLRRTHCIVDACELNRERGPIYLKSC